MPKEPTNPHQVATWRFTQIAPFLDPALEPAARRRVMRERLAVTWPNGKKHRIPRSTLHRWIRAFRQQGYEGLLPRQRSDKGKTRSDTTTWIDYAIGLLLEQPRRSLQQLEVYLKERFHGCVLPRTTLARHLVAHPAYGAVEQLRADKPPKLYGRYEARHPHECWQLDGKKRFFVRLADGRRVEVCVLSIIDDHSRAILAAIVTATETANAAIQAFQMAASRHGLPERMQFDRGSGFDSDAFRAGIAQCGVHRNHVLPRSATHQGKIEAYHRSLKRWFLEELRVQEVFDLAHLQQLLDAMIALVYQRHHHRAIGCTPEQRLAGRTSDRRISEADLARAFFLEVTATSHPKTGEVQLPNGCFRVPAAFAGKRALFRYDPIRPAAVVVSADRREIALTLFTVQPLPKPVTESRGEGQLQKLLDRWRGRPLPNAEPGFGLPEVFASLSGLVGKTVPQSERDAHLVVVFWKQHGPLARQPWLRACERTRAALGEGRALSAYLKDLERQIRAQKEEQP